MLVALGLALVQGWMQASFLERMDLLAGSGTWPLLRVTVTLAAGTFAWIGLAALADRYALVGGYSLLVGAGVVHEAIDATLDTQAKLASAQAPSFQPVIAALGLSVAAVAITWLLARKRARGELRAPASGIAPVSTWMLLFPYWLGSYGIGWFEGIERYGIAHEAAVSAALALLFAWLFNLPKNVARFAGEGIDVTRPLVRAALLSVAFVAALVLGASLLSRTGVHLGLVSVASAVAIVLDVRAAWGARRKHGDLVPVRPEHRVYAVDAALDALAHAGIPAHARGVHHRTLWQFFGPFLPIVFFVPRDCVEDATRILSRVLGDTPARRESPYRSEA
jgi:hypothetical protein